MTYTVEIIHTVSFPLENWFSKAEWKLFPSSNPFVFELSDFLPLCTASQKWRKYSHPLQVYDAKLCRSSVNVRLFTTLLVRTVRTPLSRRSFTDLLLIHILNCFINFLFTFLFKTHRMVFFLVVCSFLNSLTAFYILTSYFWGFRCLKRKRPIRCHVSGEVPRYQMLG